MSLVDFIVPFIIAVMVHALVFSSGTMNHDAEIIPQKGSSSVILNIVTSLARASHTIPNDDVPDVRVRKSMTGKQKQPVHAISELVQTPGENKTPASNPSARANTDAPELKIAPQIEETVLLNENSVQQEDQEAEQIVDYEEDVRVSRQLQQKPIPAEVGAALGTSDNDGDIREQGVKVAASAVGLSKPDYPRFSRIHGEEGTVVLSIKVLADGRTGKIEIVTSSGFRRLDEAALKAVARARFIAARIGGRSVESTKRIAFRFDLDD